MNCKPNDLAVIVRTGPKSHHLLGRPVTVHCLEFESTTYGPGWTYSPPLKDSHGRPLDFLEDAFLRPLRDPGDDAVDEMVRWCPAPREKTAA